MANVSRSWYVRHLCLVPKLFFTTFFYFSSCLFKWISYTVFAVSKKSAVGEYRKNKISLFREPVSGRICDRHAVILAGEAEKSFKTDGITSASSRRRFIQSAPNIRLRKKSYFFSCQNRNVFNNSIVFREKKNPANIIVHRVPSTCCIAQVFLFLKTDF